jgi:hypothetical protein
MISELTKAQEKQISIYLEKYRAIGLSTQKTDRAKAEKAITDSQIYLKLPPPKFIWADSPLQGLVIAARLAKGSDDVTESEIRDQVGKASFGSFEAYWVSFYAFVAENLPVKHDGLVNTVNDIVKNCGLYWVFEGVIVVTEKPVAIHMKDGKLHCEDGLALEYEHKDGSSIFSIDGVRYPNILEMAIAKSSKSMTNKG